MDVHPDQGAINRAKMVKNGQIGSILLEIGLTDAFFGYFLGFKQAFLLDIHGGHWYLSLLDIHLGLGVINQEKMTKYGEIWSILVEIDLNDAIFGYF